MKMYAYEREDGHHFTFTKGETMQAARDYSREVSHKVEVKECLLPPAKTVKERLVVAANRLFDEVTVYSVFINGKPVKGQPYR